MRFLRHYILRRKIRAARRALAHNVSPETFDALATEYARLSMPDQALKVCLEGLGAFPHSLALESLAERFSVEVRDTRLVQLKRELAQGPRPALWREACSLLLKSGDIARAEDMALDWHARSPSIDSMRSIARIRLERYFADRGREQGRQALIAIDAVMKADPRDIQGLKMRLDLCMRLKAWDDARRTTQNLLEQLPGDPVLEAQYRSFEAMGTSGMSIDRALLEVEKTGFFADESSPTKPSQGTDLRPSLRKIACRSGVHSAMYLRGSTMLVQGPRGATAERQARAVRSILSSSRASARRLGLGQVAQIQLEGEFGTLAITSHEMDAGALWVDGRIPEGLLETLEGITAVNADSKQQVSL